MLGSITLFKIQPRFQEGAKEGQFKKMKPERGSVRVGLQDTRNKKGCSKGRRKQYNESRTVDLICRWETCLLEGTAKTGKREGKKQVHPTK